MGGKQTGTLRSLQEVSLTLDRVYRGCFQKCYLILRVFWSENKANLSLGRGPRGKKSSRDFHGLNPGLTSLLECAHSSGFPRMCSHWSLFPSAWQYPERMAQLLPLCPQPAFKPSSQLPFPIPGNNACPVRLRHSSPKLTSITASALPHGAMGRDQPRLALRCSVLGCGPLVSTRDEPAEGHYQQEEGKA